MIQRFARPMRLAPAQVRGPRCCPPRGAPKSPEKRGQRHARDNNARARPGCAPRRYSVRRRRAPRRRRVPRRGAGAHAEPWDLTFCYLAPLADLLTPFGTLPMRTDDRAVNHRACLLHRRHRSLDQERRVPGEGAQRQHGCVAPRPRAVSARGRFSRRAVALLPEAGRFRQSVAGACRADAQG